MKIQKCLISSAICMTMIGLFAGPATAFAEAETTTDTPIELVSQAEEDGPVSEEIAVSETSESTEASASLYCHQVCAVEYRFCLKDGGGWHCEDDYEICLSGC